MLSANRVNPDTDPILTQLAEWRFDIEPIEPPWQAIKGWISADQPDLDWFNRPLNPSNPDPEGFDQSPTWKAPEIHLDDGRILVLEYT